MGTTRTAPRFKDGTRGVNQDFTEYPRLSTHPPTPASPGAAIGTYNADGNTVLEGRTETGGIFRFLRDQLIIGRNNTGAMIPKGALCRITGWDAAVELLTVAPADNGSEATMHAVGFAGADIPAATSGRVWQMGVLTGINTAGMALGSTLYLGANGTFTTTRPKNAGVFVQELGEVAVSDAAGGVIHANVAPSYQAVGRSIVSLGADVAIPGNAYADVTGLSFSVVAGTVYKFRANILFDSSATTHGSRWSLNGPASPTRLIYESQWLAQSPPVWTTLISQVYDAGTASGSSGFAAGNMARVEGFIVPSVDGLVTIRCSGETTGGTITAKAGSSLEYWI